MICNTCGCAPANCCCQRSGALCGECSETIQYAFQNINLAGVGVFDNLTNFLASFRGIASGDEFISVTLNGVTNAIEITLIPGSLKVQQTFADSAARMSATPLFLGQLGVQINSQEIYIGTSLAVNGWTIYTP